MEYWIGAVTTELMTSRADIHVLDIYEVRRLW